MKKVGIFTLCGNNNFGNKLQNYALLKTIKEFKYDVHTIWIEKPSNYSVIRRIAAVIKSKIKEGKNFKKTKNFIKFNKEYLNVDYSIVFTNNLSKINKKYNYVAIGSDQVWNNNYIPNISIYFGENIDKEKCFSYAASFGVSSIPESLHETYKKGLNHLKNISVREKNGKDLVEMISGRKDAEVVVDPTMLLSKDEWIEIEKKPKSNIPKKYILCYFLGKIDEDRKQEIEKVAKEYQCEIINIMDKNNEIYNIGPCEFVYLIHNSTFVFTDSFHACVFSLIFDKSFVIFDRDYKGKNMNSRIDTLLSTFSIDNRKFNNNITNDNLVHDYSKSYELLNLEKQKSIEYLKNSLNIEDSD